MVHESGEETEKPESGRVPSRLVQPGLPEGTTRPLKVKPPESDDEDGGLASRSLRPGSARRDVPSWRSPVGELAVVRPMA
jgi:hypothetical protein